MSGRKGESAGNEVRGLHSSLFRCYAKCRAFTIAEIETRPHGTRLNNAKSEERGVVTHGRANLLDGLQARFIITSSTVCLTCTGATNPHPKDIFTMKAIEGVNQSTGHA